MLKTEDIKPGDIICIDGYEGADVFVSFVVLGLVAGTNTVEIRYLFANSIWVNMLGRFSRWHLDKSTIENGQII